MFKSIKTIALLIAFSFCLLGAAPKDVPKPGMSPIADASMKGEADTVRSLLKQGIDVNASHGDGMSALHWAAKHENVEIAEMLLYAGANVNALTRLGKFTALHLAGKTGNRNLIEILLDANADVNSKTEFGTTPIMYASLSGNPDVVQMLIEGGANVNAEESAKGRTPLMFAAAFNRHEVIKVLAENDADITATTNIFETAAVEKEWSKADKERRKQRLEEAQAIQLAAAQDSGEPNPEEKVDKDRPCVRAFNEPDCETEEKKKGRSFLSKMFGWLPGVGDGGEKVSPDEQRRRNRFRRLPFGEIVGNQGGMTALHFAARQGNKDSVDALLQAGADINSQTGGDKTTPMLIATINGHFDLANSLLEKGADPNLQSEAGATPLYAAINLRWAPKALYPQPRAHLQQKLSYLDFMEILLKNGAEPNTRLSKKIWYSGYNFDLSGVNENGATPFWRAAYGTDIPAMKLLVAHGADPHVPTRVPEVEPTDGIGPREDIEDVSGLPPVPQGGPAVSPLLAAAGVGYGAGFAGNSHKHVRDGFMPTVKYLVEELGADVMFRDHQGYNAIHHAATRGDTDMIEYLVSKGCDVSAVSRQGQTTADMANGPVQRVQPWPEALALLEKLGSKNNHKCVSC